MVSPDRFATAEETAYPPKLAHAMAFAFVEALQADGWKPPTATWEELQENPNFAAMRAVAGRQPKSSRVPPLVPEHQQIVSVLGPVQLFHSPPCPLMARIKSPWIVPSSFNNAFKAIPAEAQLLRVSQVRSNGGDACLATKLVWGLPWNSKAFVEKAVERGHPRAFKSMLPEVLSEAVSANRDMSSSELAAHRSNWFSKWVGRARDLSEQEKVFKKSLSPHLQHILLPKRLLLLREMIKEEGYPDAGVFDELAYGTELVGTVPWTGVFDPAFKPAIITTQELLEQSSSSNKAIFSSVRSSGDHEVDKIVFEKTLEERDAGWLRGPVPFEELSDKGVLSRRFGLKQPNKVRLIDDLSRSNINSTVQTPEAPKPHSTDVVAALSLALLQVAGSRAVLGKTFDLKSAYRQLGIHPDSLSFSYIVCFDPVARRPAIFQMLAVPFGGSRSVYSFLRIVRVIWWMACKCLSVMWTNFYDDFVTFSWSDDAPRTSTSIELFFDLLGWQFAREGDKAQAFGPNFGALGIQIDISSFELGYVEFSNTEKRKPELYDLVSHVLDSGELRHSDALKLRGRLQFADGQLFGRIGKLCLKEITSHAFQADSSKIGSRLRNLLKMFAHYLQEGAPRRICGVTSECFYIFTDACYEPDRPEWVCGLGGIIYDSTGKAIQAFSLQLSAEQIAALGGKVQGKVSQGYLGVQVLSGPKGLETKKVIQGSALPGALTPPVMDDGAEETMWKVLQRFGLVGKKLSVSIADEPYQKRENTEFHLEEVCQGMEVVQRQSSSSVTKTIWQRSRIARRSWTRWTSWNPLGPG
eukprot:s605_g22.t1